MAFWNCLLIISSELGSFHPGFKLPTREGKCVVILYFGSHPSQILIPLSIASMCSIKFYQINDAGKTITLYIFSNKILTTSFSFTCCPIISAPKCLQFLWVFHWPKWCLLEDQPSTGKFCSKRWKCFCKCFLVMIITMCFRVIHPTYINEYITFR